MMQLPNLLNTDFSFEEIKYLLSTSDAADIKKIQNAAEKVLLKECGNKVYFRGLVEASNICRCNCHYCGIQKFNKNIERYQLDQDIILDLARQCKELGYASIALQTGERQDSSFIDYIENLVRLIKQETQSDELQEGLGITLSVGEQTPETYKRFFKAGAHRYLLRIETSNPDLFTKLHPPEQKFKTRIDCLRSLREIGYQVGTGTMIGLPDQTIDDLVNDILFFKDNDIDMIGMGPFIPHEATTLAQAKCPEAKMRVHLTLMMLATARLVLRDVNMVATTALQALDPQGREKALHCGANVMMPLMTPSSVRKNYKLYPNKSMIDEASYSFHQELEKRIIKAGRTIGHHIWGDSPHALKKNR